MRWLNAADSGAGPAWPRRFRDEPPGIPGKRYNAAAAFPKPLSGLRTGNSLVVSFIGYVQKLVGNRRVTAKGIAMLLVGFRYATQRLASLRSNSNCCSRSGEAMNPKRV